MSTFALQYDTNSVLDRFNEDCLLIRITSSLPGSRKQSKAAAKDAADANNAEASSVTASVVLFTNNDIKPARDQVRQATDVLKALTVPWNNDGWRIIQTGTYQEVYPSLKNARANFYDARDAFISSYNDKVEDAKRRLTYLFNSADFPSPREIGESFGFEIETDAIKDASDIRIKGPVEFVRQVEQEIVSRNKRKLEEAQADVVKRLIERISESVGSIQHYHDKVSVGERSAFYDSAITGIKALCTAIPKLNITKDAKLNEIGKLVLQEIGELDPKTVKDSPTVRETVIRKGTSLLDKLQNYSPQPVN